MSQECDVTAALANRPSAAPLLLPAFLNVGAPEKPAAMRPVIVLSALGLDCIGMCFWPEGRQGRN